MSDWDGVAIGGLSVGEPKPAMYEMLDVMNEALPADRPRYLMGVGFPEDLVEGARRGVDLFDCVAPTRMGRNGTAFTSEGRLNVRNVSFAPTRCRSTHAATARRARASPGRTSGTCSCPTRHSACIFFRCTMYISCLR